MSIERANNSPVKSARAVGAERGYALVALLATMSLLMIGAMAAGGGGGGEEE
jgi:hypothetical protein